MSKNLRKAVRIFPSRLELLHFHRDEPKASKVIDVGNVSITGVGLFRGKESWPETDQIIHGRFEYQGKFFQAQLRVVHHGDRLVGCRFEGNVQEVQDLFRKHFRHEVSAARMNQVRTELLNQASDGLPMLFVGPDESELFYVKAGVKVQRFVLKFFDRVIEGKLNGAIDFHQNDSERDDFVRFLQNIQNLDSEDCKQISEWILKGAK